ncbi:hypothetical protein Pcinc_033266 [Petrolisthes cinctipes]|uniref:Tyrosine-protein phosphatase domain-containing protein n=1 Tax=Petrolisthes cinctipes TaxID=88211 RepID=A0AAE1ESH1_PETCI|nr:hypothetical protein Pcinc_033266 [Petrolisthes cinctipes]
MKEFYDLEARRPRPPTTAALLIPNLTKNRTSSIVPYSNDVTGTLPHDVTGPLPRDVTGPLPPSDVTGPLPHDITGPLPPSDVTGPLPHDVTGPLPHDVTGPLPPSDVAGPLPHDVTGPLPHDVTGPLPRDVTTLPSDVTGPLPNDDYINATIVNPKFPRFWPLPGDRDQHLPPCYPLITVVQLATEKGELPPLPQEEDEEEEEEYHYHWRTKEERRDVEALQCSPYFYVTDLVIYSGGGQRRVVRHYHFHRCLESHVLYPATLHLLHHVFNHHAQRRRRGGPIVLTCPDGADLCGGFLALARLIQREAVKRPECYYFIYRCLVTFLTWQEEGGKEGPRGRWPTKRPLQPTPSHLRPPLLLKRIKNICPELPIPPSLMPV